MYLAALPKGSAPTEAAGMIDLIARSAAVPLAISTASAGRLKLARTTRDGTGQNRSRRSFARGPVDFSATSEHAAGEEVSSASVTKRPQGRSCKTQRLRLTPAKRFIAGVREENHYEKLRRCERLARMTQERRESTRQHPSSLEKS